MSTRELTSTNNLHARSTTYEHDQYTLWQILGICAGAVLPMGLSYWVITPTLLSRGNTYPFTYLFLMIMGMIWEGILAYIILRREVQPFTWQGVKDRLWLYTPSDPKTGVRSKWLFLWLIPLIAFAFIAGSKLEWLNELWLKALPFLAPRPCGVIQNLAGPAVGQWWLLGVLAVQVTFNYLIHGFETPFLFLSFILAIKGLI